MGLWFLFLEDLLEKSSKSTTKNEKINLLGYDLAHMKAFFTEIGEKPFRAVQVLKWIHQLGVDDFAQMSNVSQALRDRLDQIAVIKPPQIIMEQKASDGTIKWLMRLDSGNSIETVFIPEDNRGTLCISSQVGCALDCGFCSTAKQGFNRNLSSAEIIAQLWIAYRQLGKMSLDFDKAEGSDIADGSDQKRLTPLVKKNGIKRDITNVVFICLMFLNYFYNIFNMIFIKGLSFTFLKRINIVNLFIGVIKSRLNRFVISTNTQNSPKTIKL